jgi:hypothetical protein
MKFTAADQPVSQQFAVARCLNFHLCVYFFLNFEAICAAGDSDLSDLYRPSNGCRLHSYSIQEAAQCLASQEEVAGNSSSRFHLAGPHLVLVGDSMLRQLHLRLVSMARGESESVDVG